ncbi:alpha-mannosidase [Gracilibacillus oryzae]|uniref:alpha-mannosidase n=1 Tax=Gracilibacillus oryzae TaxID=1672701 RepID=A0A7C8GTP9_9BACI|nr:alpha-mannosidase [Gracilibacillus oryzae]KAB8134177.1 alpha-mannosidase [Gracilibacillus oryzae]
MQRIYRLIRQLKSNLYLDLIEINNWNMKKYYYEDADTYSFIEEKQVTTGEFLIHSGETAFLTASVPLAENLLDQHTGIVFAASGPGGKLSHYEGLLSVGGTPLQGFDRNRSFCQFPDSLQKEGKLDLHIELFNPVGIPEDHLRGFNLVAGAETNPPPIYLHNSKLVKVRKDLQDLLYTLETACSTLNLLKDNEAVANVLVQKLEATANRFKMITDFDQIDPASVQQEDKEIRDTLAKLAGYREGTIKAIGQSHIDVAWLWPMKETIRKASRTFSTASTLLEEFEEFEYAQSQPQLFEFVKKHYPKVFERVKKHVTDGRMEIIGGMWVEPDLNIPSGESLVRQLLYGKKYFQEEFGQKPRVEWLPDTFGYCASLPQILKKAEIDYFMTTKLNWNDTNRFPYDLFHWEGIDGTTILSYLHTILGQQSTPKEIKETWNDFNQKKEYDERMLVYGYGDGGGGVTREMIESIKRSESLPGLPDVKFSKVHDFFDRITEKSPDLPKWYGDLYLELHRGTYTTHANIKKYNRTVEHLFRNLEIWHSFASFYLNNEYPKDEINRLWKLIMLNQFHDIIPGTSIESVYELSRKQYQEIVEGGEQLQNTAVQQIASNIDTEGPGEPYVIFNSLGWNRDRLITIKGDKALANKSIVDQDGKAYAADYIWNKEGELEIQALIPDVPQFGYKTVWLTDTAQQKPAEPQAFNGKWETANYKITFNENGFIAGLYDKSADREVIQAGQIANELQLFDDLPTDWDAWDIDPKFASQKLNNTTLLESKVVYAGELTDELFFQWKINDSVVSQRMIFDHTTRLIHFRTHVDWKETNKLLKVAFPVNVFSPFATYEIPFGTVTRPTHNNTTWEQAQFEVCGQKWADLSEGSYGVSLLNDCKYGYDVKERNIRLSLLRSPKWPDVTADIHEHEFAYSLYPHQGDWRNAKTVQKGHEINTNDPVVKIDQHKGNLDPAASFVEFQSDSVVLEAIKLAENEQGVVMRLYEAEGNETAVQMKLQGEAVITETNLLEKPVAGSEQMDSLERKLKPYEISTFHVSKVK